MKNRSKKFEAKEFDPDSQSISESTSPLITRSESTTIRETSTSTSQRTLSNEGYSSLFPAENSNLQALEVAAGVSKSSVDPNVPFLAKLVPCSKPKTIPDLAGRITRSACTLHFQGLYSDVYKGELDGTQVSSKHFFQFSSRFFRP